MTIQQILNKHLVGKELQRPSNFFPYNGWTIKNVNYGVIHEGHVKKEFSILITNGKENVSLVIDFDSQLTDEE
jgi:hypothetical protein